MIVRCCVLAALIAGAWTARTSLDRPHVVTTAESLVTFPAALGSWTGTDSPLEADVLKMAAVDDYMNRYYRSNDGELGLYVGYYQSQREGEALHSPLFCLPGAGWQPIENERLNLRMAADGSSRIVNKLVVERGIDRLLVLYWYQTLTRVTASEYWRKLFLMRDAIVSGRTDVALVRIIAPIDSRDHSTETQALSLARPFAERVLPEVQRQLFRE
jgi:EpsI family protein